MINEKKFRTHSHSLLKEEYKQMINQSIKTNARPVEFAFLFKWISKIYPKKDERNQTFKVEAIFINPPDVL